MIFNGNKGKTCIYTEALQMDSVYLSKGIKPILQICWTIREDGRKSGADKLVGR